MQKSIITFSQEIAKASNEYETTNSDLKRKYLIRNIYTFNFIVSKIGAGRGSFGTGYPFYALSKGLKGTLPVINEQLRYDNQLVDEANNSKASTWLCSDCLTENYDIMPDLKQICKPCPNMENELKPRKVMNRLPDLDMWMICEDGKTYEASKELTVLLDAYGFHTSDVNPVQTIVDVEEIVADIKAGVMPKKLLPIDMHIIEYSAIKSLIGKVPAVLGQAVNNKQIPYLPIHPLSYRKVWQYDDTAYNFIHDYLSSFTAFNIDDNLRNLLESTRNNVAGSFSPEQLYEFLIRTGPDSVARRHKTPELKTIFEERVESWKTRDNPDKGEDDGWEQE